MIKGLENKATNEKYFGSIRYFSHSLKGDKRRDFILEVGKYNIYLAAQCSMSAEKDEALEKLLIKESESIAKDYNNSERSASGFLALAEFESYETISNLLLEVTKPSNIHLKVFIKLLEGNKSKLFISLIEIFLKIQRVQFLQFAVSAYQGKLLVDNENRQTLENLFSFCLIKMLYGLMRTVLEKYDLLGDLQYILKREPENIVSELFIDRGNKNLQSLRLALSICNYYNLSKEYPVDTFIKALVYNKGDNNAKQLSYAIEMALRHDIQKNTWIDEGLNELVRKPNKKTLKKIKRLKRNGLYEYLRNDQSLLNKIRSIEAMSFKVNPVLWDSSKIESGQLFNFNSSQDLSDSYSKESGVERSPQDLLTDYFRDPGKKPLDIYIKGIITVYNSTLQELSHLLRVYEIEGKVKYIFDYGCYIQPSQFKTTILMFLHKNQITSEKELINPKEVLREGQVIKFRIIGINPKNYRFNVSCLQEFIPQ